MSTSRRSPGQSPAAARAPSARCAVAPSRGRTAGRSGGADGGEQRRAGAVRRRRRTRARGRRPPAAPRPGRPGAAPAGRRTARRRAGRRRRCAAPCSSAGLSPRSGTSRDRARAEPARPPAAPGSSVTTSTSRDDRAGERGGDDVGQQREHQVGVGGAPGAVGDGRSRVLATASRFAGTTTAQLRTDPCEHTAPDADARTPGARHGASQGRSWAGSHDAECRSRWRRRARGRADVDGSARWTPAVARRRSGARAAGCPTGCWPRSWSSTRSPR